MWNVVEVGKIDVPNIGPYNSERKRFKQSHNMSGLFCPASDWCLVVSDEKRGFHRLKVSRDHDNMPGVSHGSIFDLELPSAEFLEKHAIVEVEELDLEAIANKGDVVFFVGSHANKRESGEKNPASHLVAIASIADLKAKSQVPAQWASLDKLFKGGNLLGEVLYKQLQCGGLNIEGATILGGDLLIGIRSPSRGTDGANSAAYVISTPLAGLLDEDFSGARLHALPTDRAFIGIRAMETVGNSVVAITGDAGVSDLKDGAQPECGANLNKEDPDRPFQLRLWKPASGDAFEVEPLITFDKVEGENFEGERSVAKLEAIAADPARPGAFFILYDGSDTVRYVTGVEVE